MKTLAAVLYGINQPLVIEELNIPDLKEGQVLVKIAYSGICRSQLNEINGLKGEDKYLPHTLGHEGSGTVEAVGKSVKKVKLKDKVVLTWIKGAGFEVSSTVYKNNQGLPVNSGAVSTFMAKAVISENRLVKVPDEMPLGASVLLGCAIPTGIGAVIKIIKNKSVGSIAIFGLGGIGLSVVLAARMMNIPKIIGVDISDYKFEKARKLGVTDVVNAKKNDVLSSIMEITNGQGVEYAVECSGNKAAMEAAFRSVCNSGGLCIIAGNLPQGEKISLDPFDLIKGKKIVGTWGGQTDPDIDIPMYADLYLSGKLKIDQLIGNFYSLADINKGLDELKNGATGRILINMSSS